MRSLCTPTPQARLIAERIVEVHSNAAKAHEDLARYAGIALEKAEHTIEAIEADRLRLTNEVRMPADQ